tara:strand:- start:707 stop:1111 length:405 start_codon:yes stop_codon:yes gene_type:complete
MNNFKSNYKRNRFKFNGDRGFRKRNGNGHKINGEFNNNPEFKRRNPGKNNQNAAKLIEKYNDLAREAMSNGDKILSENYLQHADHFARILHTKELAKETNSNTLNPKETESNTLNSIESNSDKQDKLEEEIKSS